MRQQTVYPEIFREKDYFVESPEAAEKKIDALIQAMTFEEKMSLLGGSKEPADMGKIGNAGYMPGVPRLGVPETVMYDGPAGVTGVVETTGLPQPSLLGCTWDEELAYQFGAAAASEAAACSGNYLLATQVDTIHTPHYSRNKDIKSEDSFLAGKLGAKEARGVQDQHVVATLKHFAASNVMNGTPDNVGNNIEDEQTLHETDLLPFEMAITEGGAGSVMDCYNKVNGHYATDSKELNIEVLRDQWNFGGSVMSDWGSVHDFTRHTGLDIEMPSLAYNNAERTLKKISRGKYSFEALNESVRHVLTGMASAGLLSLVQLDENGLVMEERGRMKPIHMEWRYEKAVENGLLEKNADISKKIVQEGLVLLKNDGQALPLKKETAGKIALIGLGAKYPVCGEQQERSFGRLSRMLSGAEALSEKTGDAYTPYPGIDYIGETIEAPYLFCDAACEKPGLIRTAGVSQESRMLGRSFGGPGGMGAAFAGKQDLDEDGEAVITGFGAPGSLGGPAKIYENEGEYIGVDPAIDFSTHSKNYRNDPEKGNAFTEGGYTWKGYLKAPEDGEYVLQLGLIGGSGRFLLGVDGQMKEIASSSTREGAQWPWDNVICTDSGMGINGSRVRLEAGKVYPLLVYAEHEGVGKDLQVRLMWSTPSFAEKNYKEALAAAAEADTILFFAVNAKMVFSLFEMFLKRADPSLELEASQKQLLLDVAAARKPGTKMIVVLQSSNAIAAGSWIDQVDALITAYQAGQEGARILTKALLGEINPSGKLSQTWPKFSEDTPWTDTEAHYVKRFRGDEHGETMQTNGIFFGYRWYDRFHVEPLFPFGHGLSYTSFAYSDLTVTDYDVTASVLPSVSLTVTNTGAVSGDEIVQVYLGAADAPAHLQMAEKQLCGFVRINSLLPGESRTVTIPLYPRMFSSWDPALPLTPQPDGTNGKWHLHTGKRPVYIGASSKDIRMISEIDVRK